MDGHIPSLRLRPPPLSSGHFISSGPSCRAPHTLPRRSQDASPGIRNSLFSVPKQIEGGGEETDEGGGCFFEVCLPGDDG